ncbi:hypothetical protein LJB86_02845 [Deltaproteobacteria bacterium OttesenSCG-928-M10]|nr:hypothetical protein [Deltaproteobacteria bacterium OttesenSCG-928-M10]
MKKFRMVLAAGFLGLALSLLLAPSSEAAPRQHMGEQRTELSIDSPNTSYHHGGSGGSYGRGRHRGGHR